MFTSNIVVFIGGPKHFKTEEIQHPSSYIQVPEKQYIGPIVPDKEPLYKVVTYRLEKYRPGPDIILPIYVAQDTPPEAYHKLIGEYFYHLITTAHAQAQKPSPIFWGDPNLPIDVAKYNEELYKQFTKPQHHLLYVQPPSPNKSPLEDTMQMMKQALHGSQVIKNLTNLIPGLAKARANCPACTVHNAPVVKLIQHLNDEHKWPIETKIADWLETLDVKFEVKQ